MNDNQLNWDNLLAFVAARNELHLETRRGHPFTARKERDTIFFTPSSTEIARPETRRTGERFLTEFYRTGNSTTSHYQQISANSSYMLTLISHVTDHSR
ncbi:hypothetical protein QPK87_10720 [Kamptonema cortianum]|nr:hypothetical protein [Geitlerinema splendidum]MDK3157046.1 hypothetical protein [Kamptonema cortianum]